MSAPSKTVISALPEAAAAIRRAVRVADARKLLSLIRVTADELMPGGALLVVHVTRPGRDPVITVPFQ